MRETKRTASPLCHLDPWQLAYPWRFLAPGTSPDYLFPVTILFLDKCLAFLRRQMGENDSRLSLSDNNIISTIFNSLRSPFAYTLSYLSLTTTL